MDMSFLISHAVLYISEILGLEQMGDHMAELLFFSFVLVPIGNGLFTWIKDYLLAWIKNLLAPMWLRLDFLLYYNRNIENLRTILENLIITRNEVQRLVNDAEDKGEDILPRVNNWQASAIEITEDPMSLLDNRLHLNPMERCQRSKSAKEKTAEVDELIQKGSSFDRVSTLRSRISILENVMGKLEDGETNRIGILGEGGVGKTFLANEIYEEAKDGDQFEEVVMAIVTSHPDLGRIQYEFADMLGLRFDERSTAGRARRLSKIFDGKKTILIILDDIHQDFELEAVGIHFRERFKGCKIVLVSQSQDVCDQLGTEMDFTIEALDENEGGILFRMMAGAPVHSQNPSAVEAPRNFAGLPRNIVRAAKAWKKNAALNL